ncbi:MAG: hypothetical protein KJ970_13280 [Candidatus Eisenbacteria bacterium]|uniref:Uncharacterized protein n=1 Tax=Eiseniibacteriota bacterium TaxID=2212470 RepID=A0A948RZ93_UNCEI|nr:hypothetical protein [Candidatus Eisenbacteria bacterium]MBU1947889.1 hypothetical protein [Candidatus Eisenbacteria bacterium]MBU2691887.1 hypothetical protein [Candidatus Eisenbacteria bacterium]
MFKRLLQYVIDKKESVSAHFAWGFGIYSAVHVRCGSSVLVGILMTIGFGIAWEVVMEIVTTAWSHRQSRQGLLGLAAYSAATRMGYRERIICQLKTPTVWKASLLDALTFWPGWIVGYFVWRGC